MTSIIDDMKQYGDQMKKAFSAGKEEGKAETLRTLRCETCQHFFEVRDHKGNCLHPKSGQDFTDLAADGFGSIDGATIMGVGNQFGCILWEQEVTP